MTPYVIFGAGAVGSALGAYLARSGHRVQLLAREGHVRAIREQGNLKVSTYDGTFSAPVEAAVHPAFPLPPGAVILLTVQAPDVGAALDALAPALPDHAVVTFQNGIQAETEAAPRCPHLYGGVVRFTSTLIDPGEVRLRRPGQLIVGRHPSGTDDTAAAMVADFNAAGFEAAVSSDIASDKALKLLVNLISGPAVLLHRTEVVPALAHVQVALLEEGRAVFAAAGVRAEPVSGLGQPVQAMIARFGQGGSAPDGRPVYNSTWQNLHHRRDRLENRYYHGEIIALGEQTGIPTPVNRRALDLLEEVRDKGLGPEPWTPEEFAARFADVVDVHTPLDPPDQGGAGLEI